jgi:hypothetical protein
MPRARKSSASRPASRSSRTRTGYPPLGLQSVVNLRLDRGPTRSGLQPYRFVRKRIGTDRRRHRGGRRPGCRYDVRDVPQQYGLGTGTLVKYNQNGQRVQLSSQLRRLRLVRGDRPRHRDGRCRLSEMHGLSHGSQGVLDQPTSNKLKRKPSRWAPRCSATAGSATAATTAATRTSSKLLRHAGHRVSCRIRRRRV